MGALHSFMSGEAASSALRFLLYSARVPRIGTVKILCTNFAKFLHFFYKTAGTQLISVVKFGLKKSLFISQPVLVQDLARVMERRP